MSNYKITGKIADWYRENYPSDTADPDWLADITWEDLENRVKDKSGPLCEWCDSTVRERVFSELSKRTAVDYDTLFDLWIEDKL